MEKSLRDRIQEIYEPFSKHKPVDRKVLFGLYNEMTGKNMQPTSCSTCLIKIKQAFESYLAENQ
jgi:hypothetical protein